MQIRVLTASDIRSALSMREAIDAVEKAYAQLASGKATMPLRSRVDTDKGISLLMPAYLHDSGDFAVKIVSIYGENPKLGLPTVTATVLAMDPDTGMPLALMEGDSLTALRTGAAGGVAARYLARKDARTVALFGAGVQARSQLQAVLAERQIQRVLVVGRLPKTIERFCAEVATWPDAPEVIVAPSPREAVSQADIVLAATTTKTPLFDGNDLKPGTHVTGVGSFTPEMQEIDAVTIDRARVVVDQREAAMAEAGDIIIAKATIDAEIGEIVNGTKPGRQNDDEITFFKSVGLAVQDAVTAAAVLRAAEEKGLGTVIQMS
ncbi:ornithine cyclodeaminase [Desulfosarcina ovata subsp. sediminis]|uniref:Ornithine cyclodeaminase n=1 Tax=Desulfosarcina ovata subsp. sediminis TaxID=885957 RepID=A0A5K7ZWM1_9BACT|nr:ornithine cyclodeaminase family protein [Desulfosarcina ovata]BBO84655.1 ornithine cyclodeaminase [Desulfosarcina ovata subsp. sediminis]